jgi:hypothetical protein
MDEGLKPFFENRSLLILAEKMAQVYGKTPFEILTCMTIYEFSFNVAVFVSARLEEEKKKEMDPNHPLDKGVKFVPLSAFGIERIVKEKK